MTWTFSIFGRHVHLTPERRDMILVTLWIFVTFKQFKFDELILYPLALYFFWAFVRDFPLLVDLVMRSLILWAFPVWWLLSLSWGAETDQILKSGLQLMLTVMICYCAVIRLTPRHIMLAVLIPAAWYGFLSLVAAGPVAARGVFASKNSLGTAMVMLWIAALCTTMDNGLSRRIRLFGLGAALLALYMIQVSNSATAVLLSLAALIIVLGLRFRAVFSGPAFLMISAFICATLACIGAFIAFAMPEFDPISQVLGAFGKDTTLTGRTILWDYATQEIARHPYLGVGTGGFWTPWDGLSTARRIYIEFHKAPYASFSFHSSFYEIAVHQGLIGLGLVIAATLWCLFRILVAALSAVSMPTIFFVCISLITLVRSLMEVGLMMPFAQLSMLFIMGALLTLKRPATSSVEASQQPVYFAGPLHTANKSIQ